MCLAQVECKNTPAIELTRNLDLAIVNLGDVARKGQAEPGTFHFPSQVIFSPKEFLKNLLLVPLADPDATINNVHGNVMDGLAKIHDDLLVTGGVLGRI